MEITTAAQFKEAYETKRRHHGGWFHPDCMEEFGDTMENYGARGPLQSLWGRAVYELYRKEPVNGNLDSAYFDAKTFGYVGTGPKGILL
jgi:hypothetical protein